MTHADAVAPHQHHMETVILFKIPYAPSQLDIEYNN